MKKLQNISLLFLLLVPCTYFTMTPEDKFLKKIFKQEETFEKTFGYTLQNKQEEKDEYIHDYAYEYAKILSEISNDDNINLDEYLKAYEYKKNFLRQELYGTSKKKPMPKLESIPPVQNIPKQINKIEPTTSSTTSISKSKKKRLRKKKNQANQQTITLSFSIPITPPNESKKNTEKKQQTNQQKKDAKIQQSLRQYEANKKNEVLKHLCKKFHIARFNILLLKDKLYEASEFQCSTIISERYDESCTWEYNAMTNTLEIFTDDYER